MSKFDLRLFSAFADNEGARNAKNLTLLLFNLISEKTFVRKFVFSYVLYFLFAATLALADSYVLFSTAVNRASHYEGVLSNLKENDVLVFSDGKTYPFLKKLGQGSTTEVIKISDHKAMRIPLSIGKENWHEFIQQYLNTYPQLRDAGVPIIKVFQDESFLPERIIVERVNVQFTLERFIYYPRSMNSKQRDFILDQLRRFARQMAHFRKVGDFFSDQIAWTGDRWVLLDWSWGHKVSTSTMDKDVTDFMHYRENFPPPYKKLFKEEITAARNRFKKPWYFRDKWIQAINPLVTELESSHPDIAKKAVVALRSINTAPADLSTRKKLIALMDQDNPYAFEVMTAWDGEEMDTLEAFHRAFQRGNQKAALKLAQAKYRDPDFKKDLAAAIDQGSALAMQAAKEFGKADAQIVAALVRAIRAGHSEAAEAFLEIGEPAMQIARAQNWVDQKFLDSLRSNQEKSKQTRSVSGVVSCLRRGASALWKALKGKKEK